MTSNALMILQVLINYYHKGSHPSFDALPEEDQKGLEEKRISSSDIHYFCLQPWEKLKKIHFSWLIPYLEGTDERERDLVLASLSSTQSSQIVHHLGCRSPSITLSRPVRHLIASRLYQKIEPKESVPLPFLPKTPLEALLDLPQDRFIPLLDCLGVYDVAFEIPYILDKEKLSSILKALKPIQKHFLKKVLHEKSRYKADKLGLDRWGGDSSQLLKVLHIRGMKRLAIALSRHKKEFLSHLWLRLDTGRSKKIESLLENDETEVVVNALQEEVKNTMEFVKTNEG